MADESLPTWALGTNTPGSRNDVTTRVAAMYLSSGLSHNEAINRVFDYDKQHNAPRLQASELFNIVNFLWEKPQ